MITDDDDILIFFTVYLLLHHNVHVLTKTGSSHEYLDPRFTAPLTLCVSIAFDSVIDRQKEWKVSVITVVLLLRKMHKQ